MGTDIHMAVEVRRDGNWHSVTKFTDEDGYMHGDGASIYEDRNYDVFAILANVRNGSGFAGIDTGDGFVPLTDNRGIPDDASPEIRKWAEQGDHSHSYCTVAELLAYDWTQKTKKRGTISSIKQLAVVLFGNKPTAWSGDISGPGIRVFDFSPDCKRRVEAVIEKAAASVGKDKWHVMRQMRWNGDDENGRGARGLEVETVTRMMAEEFGCDTPCFRVEWEVSYFEPASGFLSTAMPKLWRLGAPEDVRLVFWFDS